ncbi:uncharacterized protein LOC62_01G000771 [Vanrija pseudolonga]|uniref:RRM domain-containing protein n=1 Tax=Vanrija pseudolonga TaxID=143232 RepID=A0AAF0Y396_9TREE|nr:hypothetical protein LOC62_01G000771 [Vanrija pseudolonga]
MPSLLLFTGLPLDVRDPELNELLVADPLRLVPSSVIVTALHNAAGQFLGTFLVEVGSEADAERVRRQYGGQIIDGSHTIAVQHVLKPTQPHPTAAIPAPGQQQQQQQQQGQKKQPQQQQQAAQAQGKAPGLRLLQRLNKGAAQAGAAPSRAESQKQKLLLEKQRAAVSKGKKGAANPGDALLSRLAKGKAAAPAQTKAGNKKGAAGAQPKATAAATARKAAKKKGAGGGADKVARAKAAASDRMDVDAAAKANKAKPEKPKPKTQADLDEEMKAYERQRKFATA